MTRSLFGLFMLLVIASSTANAAPQRVSIKDPQNRASQRTAVAQLKDIDLEDIEDPAAKRAITQILNYLGLQTQK